MAQVGGPSRGSPRLEDVTDRTLEHDALIYGTDEALVETLVPWLREGLEQDESAVVATTDTDSFAIDPSDEGTTVRVAVDR